MELFGEGQYNLLSLKEIVVTDSFMGLDREARNCQNIDSIDDCKTRLYVENFRRQCGCLPLSLKLYEKVKLQIFIKYYLYFLYLHIKDPLCIENKDIFCSQNLKAPNLTSCMSIRLVSLK